MSSGTVIENRDEPGSTGSVTSSEKKGPVKLPSALAAYTLTLSVNPMGDGPLLESAPSKSALPSPASLKSYWNSDDIVCMNDWAFEPSDPLPLYSADAMNDPDSVLWNNASPDASPENTPSEGFEIETGTESGPSRSSVPSCSSNASSRSVRSTTDSRICAAVSRLDRTGVTWARQGAGTPSAATTNSGRLGIMRSLPLGSWFARVCVGSSVSHRDTRSKRCSGLRRG